MAVIGTATSAESVDPPAAGDALSQLQAIELLDSVYLKMIDLFPNCAARQLATQRVMECNFWLTQSMQENP